MAFRDGRTSILTLLCQTKGTDIKAGITTMFIKVTAIDLTKNFFQVCVLNIDGSISSNRKVHREKLTYTIRQSPTGYRTLVGVSAFRACS